jgi:hypothetical protein
MVLPNFRLYRPDDVTGEHIIEKGGNGLLAKITLTVIQVVTSTLIAATTGNNKIVKVTGTTHRLRNNMVGGSE